MSTTNSSRFLQRLLPVAGAKPSRRSGMCTRALAAPVTGAFLKPAVDHAVYRLSGLTTAFRDVEYS